MYNATSGSIDFVVGALFLIGFWGGLATLGIKLYKKMKGDNA